MRVIIVTSSYPYGPGESFLAPEIAALMRRGHEVAIAPVWARGEIQQGHFPPATRSFRATPMEAVAGAMRHPAVLAMTVAIGRSVKPSAVFKNATLGPKAAWLIDQARAWGAEHLHAYWASTPATLASVVANAVGVPWSFTMHRWDIYENNALGNKVRSACFVRAISSRGARDASAIAGASGIRVLHLGVDPGLLEIVGPPTSRPRRILVPGSLVPIKGHADLLHALALAPDIAADIAGEGPLRGELQGRSRSLGLSGRVSFLGHVPHMELLRMMGGGAYAAVVLASIDLGSGEHEGIPVSLMEAMALGVPVITTPTGSIPELVTDEVGYVVTPRDPNELAAALLRVCDMNTEAARKAAAAREKVSRDFNAARSAATLAGWMEECTKAEGSG